MSIIAEIARKKMIPRVPPCKVTQRHRKVYRSIGYLLIHSNHKPLSYRLRDKMRFSWKISKSPPPRWRDFPKIL